MDSQEKINNIFENKRPVNKLPDELKEVSRKTENDWFSQNILYQSEFEINVSGTYE